MRVLYNPENSWFIKKRPMHKLLADITADGLAGKELATEHTAEEIVDYLFTIARGCCYNWCVNNGSYDLEKQITDYVKLGLKAMGCG